MKTRSYRESIRNTLFLYALIPALLLVISLCLSLYFILRGQTEADNKSYHQRLSAEMLTVLQNTLHQATAFSTREDLAAQLSGGQPKPGLYAELYDYANSCKIKPEFHLFDAALQPLPSSTTQLPEYINNRFKGTSGIWKNLAQNEETAVAWEAADSGSYLVVGTKIKDKNNGLAGYLLFDFSEADFLEFLGERNRIDVMLTDGIHYSFWHTDTRFITQQKKVLPPVRLADGYVAQGERWLYVSSSDLLGGQFFLYTVSDPTDYFNIILIVGSILCVFLVLMTLLDLWVSHIIAERKTTVVNTIVETMELTKNGDFSTKMVINSEDEFERIAVAYNDLCAQLNRLIEDNREIATQQLVSEIRQLESQFNPHFLFNTLETIRYLVKIDSDNAQLSIVALSEILRYSVYNSFLPVSLAQELHYLENYLFIQKLRLQDKFLFNLQISNELKDIVIPRLILQPLVENAIKYGKNDEGFCSVTITAELTGGLLHIEVSDLGKLTDKALNEITAILQQKENTAPHLGLYNVHRRVQLAYGDSYGLSVKRNRHGGASFSLLLPDKEM